MRRNLYRTRPELPRRTHRSIAFPTAVMITCGIILASTLALPQAAAQTTAKRHVYVTVTDPQGRLVTGLDRTHFEVVENGMPRAITGFADDNFPIAVAIVGSEPFANPGALRLGDVLIQTRSLADAVRQLEASGLDRKVILAASSVQTDSLPGGVELIQTDSAGVQKAMIRLKNQYRLEFDSGSPSARIEVVVAKPVGMPPLSPSWN